MNETETYSNSKRIAKNTLLLYLRMIVTTIISLYTARLLLQLLGVEDFGIYNVVGGVVTFMSFLNGTMISASQRFLAYELGKNDTNQYRKTFSMTINVFIILCISMIVFLEFIGPRFVENKLTIPIERLNAAQWTLQLSLFSFILSTMTIPFQAAIVSHERMGIYAYFTLIDVISKLLICYILYITSLDRLVVYGSFHFIMTFIVFFTHYLYCRNKLEGCNYSFHWDKQLFLKLSHYAGWNLFGSISAMLCSQGQTIILNIFHGPVVNAAKAIADRINGIIASFVRNFLMAVSPQIIKTYAAGEIDATRKLVLTSSRLSFLLMTLISVPMIANMPSLLTLWLGKDQVSEDTIIFSQLVLVFTLVNTLEEPITQVVRATGIIKKYQIYVGLTTLLYLPLCYILFLYGMPAYSSMILLISIYILAQIIRVLYVRPIIKTTAAYYTKNVIIPCLSTLLISYFLTWVCTTIKFSQVLLVNTFINIALSFAFSATMFYIVGIKNNERRMIRNKINTFIKKQASKLS